MDRSDLQIEWLPPLFTNAGGWEAVVGQSIDGQWYLDPENPIQIGKGNTGVQLLPLMQPGYGGSLPEVKSLIQKLANESGSSLDVEKFPYHVPVEAALNGMFGWLKYTDSWISCLQLTEDKSLKYFKIAQDNHIEQKIRQKLMVHINNWTKKNGYCLVKE
jgi:hypothetical protein